MEGISRLVSESLARHGFDRLLDYRRLHWSRWFRCESLHSLVFVPSKPGVFALAEEVMELSEQEAAGDPAIGCPEQSQATPAGPSLAQRHSADSAAPRRMLAVTQFFEDDDMAFVLGSMLSDRNPMRVRLASGRYFVRFVVIEDQAQRRSIYSALQQWISNSGEKVSGIGAHFATSLELTEANVARTPLSASPDSKPTARYAAAPQPAAGAAANIHRPAPFPSGF